MITYKLRPPKKNPFLDKLDSDKRKTVEEIMDKKLSDYEWIKYKQMTMVKNPK